MMWLIKGAEYLGEVATPLLLRIMSHPKGLEFLTTLDYVDKVCHHFLAISPSKYAFFSFRL